MLEALLSGPDFMNDPFIPQRGRRTSRHQPRSSFRRKRDALSPNEAKIRQILEQTLQTALRSGPDYMDDPFIPQRGRRASEVSLGVSMRKKRDASDAQLRKLIEQTLQSALLSGSDYVDDPFIPQRGRRSDRQQRRTKRDVSETQMRQLIERTLHAALQSGSEYINDPFIPQRGRREQSHMRHFFTPPAVNRQRWIQMPGRTPFLPKTNCHRFDRNPRERG